MVTLPASAVTFVLVGNTMHKAPATKGLATVVEVAIVDVVAEAGALEHTRTPCVVAVTVASTEVPSADVTRPLPDSAAGAVGDTNGAFPEATVVVAPVFVVVELPGATVEEVAAAVVEGATVEEVVVAAVVEGATVEEVVVERAVVDDVVEATVLVVVSATVLVVVSATVVAGETFAARTTPSCAKPAMPRTPARRSTFVARVVECVMLCPFRRLQVRNVKEPGDLLLCGIPGPLGSRAVERSFPVPDGLSAV